MLQEQYVFVYDALLEALKSGNTAIPCSMFREEYEKISHCGPEREKSLLQEQFEVSPVQTYGFSWRLHCLDDSEYYGYCP